MHLTHVRELSGNFVMTIKFFPEMISHLLLVYFFSSPKIFAGLVSLSMQFLSYLFQNASFIANTVDIDILTFNCFNRSFLKEK